MRDFIIVGRPNSGKTLFALNFASFLGSKTVDVTSRSYDNLVTCKHYQIDEAKKETTQLNMINLIIKKVKKESNEK